MTYPQPPHGPGPFGPGPYGPGPYRPPPAPSQAGSGLGTAAMVLGILALLLGLVPLLFVISYVLGPAAVILGIVALSRGRRRAPRNKAAVAGLVLGALGLTAAVVWTVVLVATAKPLQPVGRIIALDGSASGDSHPGTLPLGEAVSATYQGTSMQVVVLKQQVRGNDFGILVEYVCVTGPCPYSPADWSARDDDGSIQDASGGGSFGPLLASGVLTSGQRAQGWVTSFGPDGADEAVFESGAFSGAASWGLPPSSLTRS